MNYVKKIVLYPAITNAYMYDYTLTYSHQNTTFATKGWQKDFRGWSWMYYELIELEQK